jgi:hypothetical protein
MFASGWALRIIVVLVVATAGWWQAGLAQQPGITFLKPYADCEKEEPCPMILRNRDLFVAARLATMRVSH